MLFGNKGKKSSASATKKQVLITRQAADGIITYSKTCHPNEGILVLRGKSNKNEIVVDSLILPLAFQAMIYHLIFLMWERHIPIRAALISRLSRILIITMV